LPADVVQIAVDGPTRERLFALIEREPGLHKTALCAATGLAWGTVDYHLRLLSRAGRVTMARVGRETRCFPGQLAPQHESLLATLTSGPSARIALALRHMPGQGVGALSERLGLSSKVVRRHLLLLVDRGLLERAGFHRPRYQLRPEAEPLLDRAGALARPAPPESSTLGGPVASLPLGDRPLQTESTIDG
jgi:predicted transcriptional regulator